MRLLSHMYPTRMMTLMRPSMSESPMPAPSSGFSREESPVGIKINSTAARATPSTTATPLSTFIRLSPSFSSSHLSNLVGSSSTPAFSALFIRQP